MRRWIIAYVVVFLVLMGACAVLVAQEKPVSPAKIEAAPVLSEVDALKLENAVLKAQAAQAEAAKRQAELQALVASLQRPGYQIAQGQDGKLGYIAEPKKEPEKK